MILVQPKYLPSVNFFKDFHDNEINIAMDLRCDDVNDINKTKETGEISRRMIMSAWNVEQLDEMALPPCHVLSHFHITEGNKLSCSIYQRSADMGLGVPFNIASYSFLTHLIAKHCDLEAKEFIHFIGNAHIYDDHIESLSQQIENIPLDPPKINIKSKRKN